MYEKNDKAILYWLIDELLSGKITASKFCDEFYLSYSLSVDHATLTLNEKEEFSSLDEVAGRFSEYEEDHRLDPKAFASIKELKERALGVKNKLI
jgi:hypothetical protein